VLAASRSLVLHVVRIAALATGTSRVAAATSVEVVVGIVAASSYRQAVVELGRNSVVGVDPLSASWRLFYTLSFLRDTGRVGARNTTLVGLLVKIS